MPSVPSRSILWRPDAGGEEWTSSWKIPAHLHISYLWLKSTSLPLREERCSLFYILKKKKIQRLKFDCRTFRQPSFPQCSNTPMSLCLPHTWVFECQLMRAHFKLSCFQNIFFFLFSWKSSLSGSQQFDFSFNSGGLTASEMFCLCHYLGKGMKRSDLIYQSLSDKDGFAIKEANDKKTRSTRHWVLKSSR